MKWPDSLSQYKAVIVIGLMVAILFLFNLGFVFWAIEEVETGDPGTLQLLLCGIIWGVFLGQLNLVAIWGAMTDGSLLTRIPWSILLVVVLWMSYVGGKHLYVAGRLRFYVQDVPIVIFGAYLAIGNLVAQLLLWLASFRWVFSDGQESRPSARFELQQIFLCIVLLALTLAAGRVIAQPDAGRVLLWDTNMFLFPHIVALFLMALINNLALAMPCIWIALRRRITVVGVLAALVTVGFVSTATLGVYTLCFDIPFFDVWEWSMYLVGLNLGQVAIVYLCLRILKHIAGFRLLRRST